MAKNSLKRANHKFENYLEKELEGFVLRLYITGATPRSCLAVTNLKKFCEDNIKGQYQLEVIDIYQYPELAKTEQIIAAPTLIKHQPLPRKVIVGDLSNQEWVKRGLGITS